jgi:ABC-type transporter Mla subunit MlaD
MTADKPEESPVLFTLTLNAVGTVVADSYARLNETIDYSTRVAGKVEQLLDEVIETIQVTRPVIAGLADAMETGLLDDVRAALRSLDDAVELVGTLSHQLEQALPIFDATGPALGLVNTTIEQVNALPGAKFVRRRITRTPTSPIEELPDLDS